MAFPLQNTLITLLAFTGLIAQSGCGIDAFSGHNSEHSDEFGTTYDLSDLRGLVTVRNRSDLTITGTLNGGSLALVNCKRCTVQATIVALEDAAASALSADRDSDDLKIVDTSLLVPATMNGIFSDAKRTMITGTSIRGGKIALVLRGAASTMIGGTVSGFAEDGIRVMNHDITIDGTHVEDLSENANAHHDAIQVIPPDPSNTNAQFRGAQSSGVSILNTTITGSPNGSLQGIFGSDGYFVDTVISGNTITVGSAHGISFNGALNLKVIDNHVSTLKEGGILVYVTRHRVDGENLWKTELPYSAEIRGNTASTLNLPTYYQLKNCETPSPGCADNAITEGITSNYKR